MLRKLVTGNNKLAREITLTLIIKVILIYGIWYFFFSTPVDDSLTDDKVHSQILGMTFPVPGKVEQGLRRYVAFNDTISINAASIEENINGS